ncbi:MAG: phenylalanine--tRNA ligase subunit beta [Deltaproteobacteria bacterium]
MRVSLNWLKEFVPIDRSPQDLADLLTMAGLEVEAMEPIGHSLQDVVAAKILSVERHPEADRLFVCRMNAGKEEVPVVCGAQNLEAGAMVPMALPGTKLPGGLMIEESIIRGVHSVGMLLAEDEMGLTDDHSGIMLLPPNLAPGMSVAPALALEDWALEIALTPNRADCASVIGIAREIGALTGQKLKKPEIKLQESGPPIKELARITVEDPIGCPRYGAGMIRNIEIKPSPFRIRYRLYVAGIRSISNIVDVTNYVLLEMGQPLHAFDYDRLKENRIVVRRAQEGETFTTLDGTTHTLSDEVLMICDGQRSVAVAGIMGGLNSEIFAGSRNVLIESAFFDPVTIRRGAKRLGLSTEASYRFERGIDIEGVIRALQRSLMLMADLAGGEVTRGVLDVYSKPYQSPLIDLRVDKTNRFLGTSLSQEAMAGYLRALELGVEKVEKNVLRVKPPAFRVDLTRDVDLMEEVARLEGFDNVPVTYPPIKPSDSGDLSQVGTKEKIVEIMAGLGLTEIISYSFISPESVEFLGAEEGSPLRSFVTLLNPLTVDQSVMRTSLVPGLLTAAKTNFAQGEKDLKLFELGRIFLRRETKELPEEKPFLAAMMTGLYNPKEWFREERPVDFFDMKGALEALLKALGLKAFSFVRQSVPPWYNKDVAVAVFLGHILLGHIGRVRPEVLRHFGLETETLFLFELDVAVLAGKSREVRHFEPLTKFPAVYRDLSLVLARGTESAQIQDIIKREGGKLVESATLFDHYEGGKIDPSEKAVAFRICYRSKEGTLDGRDVNKLHEAIIKKIAKETSARLREV